MTRLAIFILISVSFIDSLHTFAQTVAPTECGAIIEAELTQDHDKHDYSIQLSAGDVIRVQVDPIGTTFFPFYQLFDPTNRSVDGGGGVPIQRNTEVSASGIYRIQISGSGGITIGAYILAVGCTLRDGTVIGPGDLMPNASTTTVAQLPAFSGFGFPGLNPVDFSSAVNLPLIPATPMTGALTPTGSEILGFQFDANANDSLQLDFTRLSGNLNLGLVVLSANNEVVFQSSLVTSETLSTRLTLPSAGQFTIGVFRIELLPPANPEATAFQITGTLNP